MENNKIELDATKRVLITGGAGFIGSHLAERLLGSGHEVTIIDNLSTGSIANIDHIITLYGAEQPGTREQQPSTDMASGKDPQLRFLIDSVTNTSLMSGLIDECDVIFHLAAAVGVRTVMESQVHTINSNVNGTHVLLELASEFNKKVILASTSEVYGKSSKIPFSEDDDLLIGSTVTGRWSYSCSKALNEFLAIAYWNETQLPVIVARLFNTVGPRQTGRYGMVLPNFVRQALAGEAITVHGDGTQRRCFTYVGDVVEALVRLSNCDNAIGEVFNIGARDEVSIGYLAQKVRDHTGSASPIQHIPYNEIYDKGFEDIMRRVPDTAKIRKYIDWSPRVQLDEILCSVIDYYRNRMSDHASHQTKPGRAMHKRCSSERNSKPGAGNLWDSYGG